MFRLILVPVDGSKFSEAALPPAIRMASTMGATVELITVHEPIPTLDYELWERQAHKWSAHYLEELVERLRAESGAEFRSKVLAGDVADAIEQEVEASQADIVVMASHGRGAFSRLWLGSSSDQFIRRSRVPVLLVKPEESSTLSAPGSEEPFEHMLVPMDGSKHSESVLECALDLGKTDGVRYTFVRVFPYPAEFASAYLPHTVQLNAEIFEESKREADAYVQGKAREFQAEGLDVSAKLVVDASPAAGILHTADEVGADLIAMATHGRGGVNRLMLGSVADKILRAAHVPVLMLRPGEERQ
jgi:nucleotide-binding universal stress UspA family protein